MAMSKRLCGGGSFRSGSCLVGENIGVWLRNSSGEDWERKWRAWVILDRAGRVVSVEVIVVGVVLENARSIEGEVSIPWTEANESA